MALTKEQIENIQIDYGIIFVNYGETDQKQLGPTRGGGVFTVTKNIRDIEFDGRKGKTKGLQVVDEIDAQLSVKHLDATLETLKLAMPYAACSPTLIKVCSNALGLIQDEAYLKNVTMFAKVVGGGYKKITLFNAMSEADFTLTAAPKAEGEMPLEVYAHWDATDDTASLFEIEDIQTIDTGDTVPPTVTTDPNKGATGVPKGSSLVATFNESVRANDINLDNFRLIKADDGTIVAGALTFSGASNQATFKPSSSLASTAAYIWTISGVRDIAGNIMLPVVINFTTGS